MLPSSSFLSVACMSVLLLSDNLCAFFECDIFKQQISVCKLCQMAFHFSLHLLALDSSNFNIFF